MWSKVILNEKNVHDRLTSKVLDLLPPNQT